jgi:metal-sulfur cluster biosynthetic enzyme
MTPATEHRSDQASSDLLRQLANIPEPCSIAMGNPLNICEMGLVEEATLVDGVARVVLCLTDPACINYGKIRQYITDSLMQLDSVKAVEVTHTTEVLWTPDRVRRGSDVQRVRVEQRGAR